MNLFEELRERGLIQDYTRLAHTSDDAGSPLQLPEYLQNESASVYCGFDPTADSLHVGSLVPLIALRRFQMAGHSPIAVAGGATGSIGDPSGKSQERFLLTADEVCSNVEAIKPQLSRLLDFDAAENPARLVDNADWFRSVAFIDFLRDIGKHFTVNQMLAKETVKARMGDAGISYTEFSYMLMQAYDFYHLADSFDCRIQIGGSDQWGNITAGTDLIRRKLRIQAYGLTLPLISKADGTKFGKTESGTVWLDSKRTSVYQFYQFWISADDLDVVRYLKYFTFLSLEEIQHLEQKHLEAPHERAAHSALAKEVTTLIHGERNCQAAAEVSSILFGGSIADITPKALELLGKEVHTVNVAKTQLEAGIPLVDAMVMAKLSQSKSKARTDIEGGGAYVNGERDHDISAKVSTGHLLHGKGVLLRRGKRSYALMVVE